MGMNDRIKPKAPRKRKGESAASHQQRVLAWMEDRPLPAPTYEADDPTPKTRSTPKPNPAPPNHSGGFIATAYNVKIEAIGRYVWTLKGWLDGKPVYMHGNATSISDAHTALGLAWAHQNVRPDQYPIPIPNI